MERESFEDEATAALMNEYFINVKIDREERPDVDHVYMDAVQAMTGAGGWPLNVFVTPDGKPFYGGTYFPPSAAFNRPSWSQVLESVHDAWTNRKEEIESQAENLLAHLQQANELSGLRADDEAPSKKDCKTIVENLMKVADKELGGFGKAPKFPQTFSINCLLRAHYYLGDDGALEQAELSLTRMIESGIYDQVRGGLCRYSTDAEWRVPHFEKMLYDNALFLSTLADAYKITQKQIYADTINHTFEFLEREMRADKGYMSALDADSEGEEGKFYLWRKDELKELLTAPEFDAVVDKFDIREQGNFHSHEPYHAKTNILHSASHVATTPGLSSDLLKSAFLKMRRAQDGRVRPGTDDKVLMGWNGLLLKAFCSCYAGLGDVRFLERGVSLAQEIDAAFRAEDGSYRHTYKGGVSKIPAFLDDYVGYSEGLLALHQVTLQDEYLKKSENILRMVIAEFSDEASLLFYFTGQKQTDNVLKKKELYDGAVPSGNAIAASCLFRIGTLTGNTDYIRRAEEMASSLKAAFLRHPGSFGNWAALWMDMAALFQEISLPIEDMTPRVSELLPGFWPNALFRLNDSKEGTGYQLCVKNTCALPLKALSELHQNALKALFNGLSTI